MIEKLDTTGVSARNLGTIQDKVNEIIDYLNEMENRELQQKASKPAPPGEQPTSE